MRGQSKIVLKMALSEPLKKAMFVEQEFFHQNHLAGCKCKAMLLDKDGFDMYGRIQTPTTV